MARKSQAQRQAAHRREVESHKRRLREEMQTGGHIFAQEWYREYTRNGDHAAAEAIEEMMGEIGRHNRNNPPDFPRQRVDDHLDDMRDLERRRQEARDLERAAGIAEGARKKAAGIGGGLFATPEPEPEPEDDEPDPDAEGYEQQRQTMRAHGLVSRMPAPPQEPQRKKKRRGYSYPPFSS